MGAGVEQLTEKAEQLLKLIEGMSNVGGERLGHVTERVQDGCLACKHTFNLTLLSPVGLGLHRLAEVCLTPPPSTIRTVNISALSCY